jgi:transcriptional antiterminator NusG
MLENSFGKSKKIRPPQTFRVGGTVRITEGPFNHFTGKIEGINKNKALLLVKVEISGRTAPIKINFLDAENI